MPRTRRHAPGGLVYHVLNRRVGRETIFHKPDDYAAFLRVLAAVARDLPGCRCLAYCLMPNHWHLVLWPQADGDLSAFVGRLTHTHTQRYRAHYHSAGDGHLYQGRFKSFPVQRDAHLLLVLRYVERNALRANLVARAEDWPWGSAAARRQQATGHGNVDRAGNPGVPLADWPVDRPADWLAFLNEPQSAAELGAIRDSVTRGAPFGADAWRDRTAADLGLAHTLRPPGRPPKRATDATAAAGSHVGKEEVTA